MLAPAWPICKVGELPIWRKSDPLLRQRRICGKWKQGEGGECLSDELRNSGKDEGDVRREG